MTGEIYIAITGDGNELWADCLERKLVALGYDKPYFYAWKAGDRDEFLRLEMKAAYKGAIETDVKGRATTWFNRATRIAESQNGIWLHRAGNDLYWSVSTDILTISTTERRRWLEDCRLPSAGTRTVKLRGRARQITFHVFDPTVVVEILDSGAADEWREDDVAAAAEKRRHSAVKAKLSRSLRKGKEEAAPKNGPTSAPLRGWDEFDADGFLNNRRQRPEHLKG